MKKKINILLIAVVVGLWGYIGYRFIKNMKQDEIASYNANNQNIDLLTVKRDTFDLEPLKRDPFLNRTVAVNDRPAVYRQVARRAVTTVQRPVIKKEPLPPVPWPKVEYFGYIKSGKNEELAVLRINSQMLKLHDGQTDKGISIKKIFKDSISIQYNSEIKTFRKIT